MTPALPLVSRRDAIRHGLLGAAGIAGLALARPGRAAASALPGDSLYQLRAALVDQDGHPFELASLRGNPALVSMFYSSCEMVCPILFETVAHTVHSLKPAMRDRLRIVMVSFDPERDTVAVLKETAVKHGCDAHWSLVRGSDADVRRIAALLGVQYRRLPSGEFNHSSSIELLDAEGRIVKRSTMLGQDDPAFIAAIQSL
jgi:protein SCO1/2